jgi:DNA-binding response OmpR family regulator
MNKLLLIEGDVVLRETLEYHLAQLGYQVMTAHTGELGISIARNTAPDLILLDTSLPVLDGFATCRALRQEHETPIVLLTEQRQGGDGIYGLDQGADDFVIKPVNLDELRARLQARLRQNQRNRRTVTSEFLTTSDIRIDLGRRTAFLNDAPLTLSQKEFDLLVCLIRYRGLVLPREVLQKHVWGDSSKSDIRTVDVHIRWLREKLEADPSRPRYIQTVRGAGYRFNEASDS